jgi:CHRD domain
MSRVKLAVAVALLGAVMTVSAVAIAGGGGKTKTRLSGLQEVPAVLTQGSGKVKLDIDDSARTIGYTVNWEGLEGGDVTQAHIHIGQRLANGGVAVWFCGNPSPTITPPAGTQTCPAGASGTVSGTLTAANVGVVEAQGLRANETAEQRFDDLVRAIRTGLAYANVHTQNSPGGEVRGQFGGKKHNGKGHNGKGHNGNR